VGSNRQRQTEKKVQLRMAGKAKALGKLEMDEILCGNSMGKSTLEATIPIRIRVFSF